MAKLSAVRRALELAGVEYQQPDAKTVTTTCPLCSVPDMTGTIKYGKIAFVCSTGCDETQIAAKLMIDRDLDRYEFDRYAVTWTDEKTPKLILPDVPAHDDLMGQLSWLTSVLNLDRAHPVTRVRRYGKRGTEGDVEMTRGKAAPLTFEPAACMNTARRLLPALGWQLLTTDAEPHGFKDEHCKRIAHVTHMACETCVAPSEEQEAAALVGMFTLCAVAVEGYTTYGTVAERFEALECLRPEINGTDRYERMSTSIYLIDSQTDEIVVRVSDMRNAARTYVGGQIGHGWLDSHMARIGWERAVVQGYAEPGRAGRKGPHLRCDFYRGQMPQIDGEGTES